MKKVVLLMLVASALFFSCQKEDVQPGSTTDAVTLKLKINVNKVFSRSIENGHDGVNDAEVSPKILNVTILAYNEAGTLLSSTDLKQSEIKDAIWGNYRDKDGVLGSQTTPPTGATVGLPSGTYRVDVVVNRASVATITDEANINYVNYRDNTDGNGNEYSYGKDNFDRVILVTDSYGFGVKLEGNLDTSITDVPTYRINFQVKPYLARMEVYGAINVAEEEVWTDGHNNKWRTMLTTAYKALNVDNVANETGHYPKGAINGTVANGFDETLVYIPEYYWHRATESLAEPVARTVGNTFNSEADIDASLGKAGWLLQPYYEGAGVAAQVKWYPNRYHAVDVESVFVNNIKVRGINHDPYLHPWPGSDEAAGWPGWYNAFHIGGWHTDGISAGNSFLCMGNMWDGIAFSQKVKEVQFPAIGGIDKMDILVGKAFPVLGKSEFYAANDRNLGILKNSAAAYAVYPQSKSVSTSPSDAAVLRKEMPHIIIKVKAYKNKSDYDKGTYASSKEFITVSLFTDQAGGAGSYITNFMGGYIYRFNLNDLLYSFVGDIPVPEGVTTVGPIDPIDPDPEMPTSQLIMQVEIQPWKINNIYPSI